MPVSLLTTKLFFPPARRGHVPRPRLIERLSAGLHGPLTLVCAPAGYGKTTLLSAWRAGPGRDVPVAWVSLDAGDSDLVLFLRYLVAALGSLQAGLADQTALLLESSPLPPSHVILTSLVNELSAFPDDLILILDDYHVLASGEAAAPEIHDAMAFLLAHAPPHLHLVLLTREDPPLPLPKLRARGQMVEIREADLRFTAQEAAAFLAQTMELVLSEETVAVLADRTEGWAAGLQMAGLSLRNEGAAAAKVAAFEGQDRYVMDYLMDEVFDQQSESVQSFLLCTSILERLCAPLCDALLERETRRTASPVPSARLQSSQEILEYLERANLFVVPLDNRREWYRYHHLFADLLTYRLQRESPDLVPELHRRASRWYAQSGSPDEAMRHALAVPDHGLAAGLAEQYLVRMIGGSRLGAYLDWMQQLPQALILQRAYLCVGSAWATVLTHQTKAALGYVEAGERALPHYRPVCNALDGRWVSHEEVRGSLAAIRAYAERDLGELDAAIEHARQALEILPQEALAIRCAVALSLGFLYYDRGELNKAHRAFLEALETAQASRENVYVAISALGALADIAMLRGKLNEAEGLLDRAIGLGTDESGKALPIPAARLLHGWLVLLHYQRNEIETAQQHLDVVLPAVEQVGDPQAIVRVFVYQALLDQSRGAFDSAAKWHRKAEQIRRDHPPEDPIQTEGLVVYGQSLLAQGEISAVSSLLSERGIQLAGAESLADAESLVGDSVNERAATEMAVHLEEYLLLARLLLAQGLPDQAMALLERICVNAAQYPNVAVLLGALALRAGIAARRQRDAGVALSTLEQALDLAAPEGYVQPFLSAGTLLVKPLRQAILRGIHSAYAQKLLAAISDRDRLAGVRRSDQVVPGAPELIEPLTERETQVLRLLAAGLSSTEVAEELVIAVSTSRSYIKSLYGKLDAHSRDEAIEKGQLYGLIQ